jgi:autotransporter-associated beta strand protein
MLLIDGALAAWNGMLVAAGKIWCECVRGGVCCGGECRCDEGYCCDDTWHPDANPNEPCAEGEIFLRWGAEQECCGCVPATIFDGRVQENVNTADVVADLCCPSCTGFIHLTYNSYGDFVGCRGRCCDGEGCEDSLQADCLGEWYQLSCCEGNGCPRSCCTEDAGGASQCDTFDELRCTGVVDTEPCETACKGACCVDDELVEDSPTTQAECDAVGGCWWGAGSTECGTEGFCRAPFDDDCCESVVSSAELLTFTGPRKRRCPELPGCSTQVTVEVTTGSPVYIHGGLFGAPYEACTDEVTFVLCNDQFHVTPAPCSGNLQGVNIKTCWEEGSGDELLLFRCCQDITHLIGNCDCGCETTVLYEGGGCTSNAAFVMRGDATIDASGTGALVLTGNITQELDCQRTLTLAGSNTNDNQISGVIQNGSGTAVSKTGVGVWRLSGNSTYSGQLRVLDGTLVVAAIVTSSGASPCGTAILDNLLPIIGNSAAGATGTASLLIAGGNSIERGFSVAASNGGQIVVLGATDTGSALIGTAGTEIRLNRSAITLQAADTAEAVFAGNWRDGSGNPNPTVAYTIGAPGNAGVVAFESVLSSNASGVNIVNGTARLTVGNDDRINPATPVTIGSSIGPTTLDIFGQSQTLANVAFTVASGSITNGTLRLTGTVATTGTGHLISSAVALDAAVTFSGSGELTISGVVSGSESLTYTGTGTLTLEGANTYTGTTTVSNGTLVLSGTLAATSQISIGTATLECTGSTKSANAVEITGAATQQGSMTVGTLSGSGSLSHDGGTLTLTNASTLTGALTVSSGSLVLNAIVSGGGVASATFTPSVLTVDFSSAPSSGNQFVLLGGPTGGTYGTVSLTNADGATGTYDSATSTLTID